MKTNDSATSSRLANAQTEYDMALLKGNLVRFLIADARLRAAKMPPGKLQNVTRAIRRRFNTKRIACDSSLCNIFIMDCNVRRCVQMDHFDTLSTLAQRCHLDITNSWYTFAGKPINTHTLLCAYGVSEGSVLIATHRLIGGSQSSQDSLPDCEDVYDDWFQHDLVLSSDGVHINMLGQMYTNVHWIDRLYQQVEARAAILSQSIHFVILHRGQLLRRGTHVSHYSWSSDTIKNVDVHYYFLRGGQDDYLDAWLGEQVPLDPKPVRTKKRCRHQNPEADEDFAIRTRKWDKDAATIKKRHRGLQQQSDDYTPAETLEVGNWASENFTGPREVHLDLRTPQVLDRGEWKYNPQDQPTSEHDAMSHDFRGSHTTEPWVRRVDLAGLDKEEDLDFSDLLQIFDNKVDIAMGKLVEDFLLYGALLYRAKDWKDQLLAMTTFVKLRTPQCSITHLFKEPVRRFLRETFGTTPEVQGLDDILENVRSFRCFITNWEKVKDSDYAKKFARIMRYVGTFGVLSFYGVEPDEKMLKAMEQNSFTPWEKASFFGCLVDFLSLTVERACVFLKTGSWQSFFHGEVPYARWLDDAATLRRQSLALGNLEAVGTSYFEFVCNLKDCISRGDSLAKFSGAVGLEAKMIKSTLNDLKITHDNLMCAKAAQQERQNPFSLLVFGGSSVMKSHFTLLLFHHFGKLRGLPTGSEYRFVRNASDQFWSGFNSQQWCVQLDDIGFLHAAKAQEDLSLLELIQLCNSVPLVPNQADLKDKGRTPVRAKLVIATSNAKDLNAATYFHCPLAVQRRLPWVITLAPKPEFARDDSPDMVDPAKIPVFTDSYADIWIITVERVVQGGVAAGRTMATHEHVATFTDIEIFLDWLKEVIVEFDQIQGKAMRDVKAMQDFKLCPTCSRIDSRCICKCAVCGEIRRICKCVSRTAPVGTQKDHSPRLSLQGAEFVLPLGKKIGDPHIDVQITSRGAIRSQYIWNAELDLYTCLETRWSEEGVVNVEYTAVATETPETEVLNLSELGQISLSDLEKMDTPELCQIIQRIKDNRVKHRSLRKYAGVVAVKTVKYAINTRALRWATFQMLEFSFCRSILSRVLDSICKEPVVAREAITLLGTINRIRSQHPLATRLLQGLAILGALASTYVLMNKFTQRAEAHPTVIKTRVPEVKQTKPISVPNLEQQGQRLAVASDHFKKTEKANVWIKDDYQTTSFDVNPIQNSFASLPVEQVSTSVARNLVRVAVIASDGAGSKLGNAVCVGGHLWVTCKHFFLGEGESWTLKFLFEPEGRGASRNFDMVLYRKDAFFHAAKDQVWFEARGLEVKRDITSLIAKPSLDGVYDGVSILTHPTTHQPVIHKAKAVIRVEHPDVVTDVLRPYWRSNLEIDTRNGDCGGILLAHKPRTVVLGLHYMGGDQGFGFAVPITSDDVSAARARFVRPLIQSGEPLLNASTTAKVLGPLHHKAPVRFLESGSLNVYGSFEHGHLRQRSKVRKTYLSDRIAEERKWQLEVGRPELGSWKPWSLAYLDVLGQQHIVPTHKIDMCVEAFVNDIVQGLSDEAKRNLQRLNTYDAINGISGVSYLDKINFNTSMGEPHNHTKKQHIHKEPSETAPEGRMFDDETMGRIERLINLYEAGVRGMAVFSGQQKDEARSLIKILQGKIRIFTGCPVDMGVAHRSYLMTFVKVFQENSFLFEGAVGVTAQSTEWENFYRYLTQFGLDRMIAGDYGKFDKKMLAEWILAAYDVIIGVLRAVGWTEEELLPIYAMAEDVAFPIVNMNGDVVGFRGSNPSGHPLTVIINCIVNSLYMRYCFATLSPDEFGVALAKFKKYVALLTYGDDNTAGVSAEIPWFNHTAIAQVLATIGVEYTMADKESESVPFIHIDDVSFLKRTWRWNDEAGAHFCPLEVASIKKMLMIACRDGSVSDQKHMADVIRSANGEWFWHGREEFEKEHAYLLSLLDSEVGLFFLDTPLETWDTLMARFHNASKGVQPWVAQETVLSSMVC
nr:MAG: structural polyprotein [Chemarfal virus 252]